jgi:hypothetical protein
VLGGVEGGCLFLGGGEGNRGYSLFGGNSCAGSGVLTGFGGETQKRKNSRELFLERVCNP